MEKEKFRLSVIDALPLNGQIPSGWEDSTSKPLYLGDTVSKQGSDERFLIGYRYGKFVLLPMFSYMYIGVKDGSHLTKLNVVTAAADQYLVIGYTDEEMYEQLKDKV